MFIQELSLIRLKYRYTRIYIYIEREERAKSPLASWNNSNFLTYRRVRTLQLDLLKTKKTNIYIILMLSYIAHSFCLS